MYLDVPLKRDFCVELCRLERWSDARFRGRRPRVDTGRPCGQQVLLERLGRDAGVHGRVFRTIYLTSCLQGRPWPASR